MAVDRLDLAIAFEQAGIVRDKAEKVAQVVMDAIHDNVATKADIDELRHETRADIEALRQETKIEFAQVRREMSELKHELTVRGLAALVTVNGLLFAALHLWPAR
jgi:hypothetical protein